MAVLNKDQSLFVNPILWFSRESLSNLRIDSQGSLVAKFHLSLINSFNPAHFNVAANIISFFAKSTSEQGYRKNTEFL